MEAKLKALKVVDLKDILAKANVTVTGKANKQDLIAKILGAPDAVDVYNKIYVPAPTKSAENAPAASSRALEKSEAPPPPKASAPASPPKPSKAAVPVFSKPASQAAPDAPDAPATTSATSTPATATATNADAEEEKRKARAARFGIAVVEPKSTNAPKNGKVATNGKAEKAGVNEDAEKLAVRAARFGTQALSAEPEKSNGRKRAAPPSGPVDEEELSRRKKRAERFGIPLVPMNLFAFRVLEDCGPPLFPPRLLFDILFW
ncbi:hypothetical protein LXA43DRAFT_1079602, partial [Ganoderma leucocontextum]